MDIKIAGLKRETLSQALEQAREGRIFILGKMMETLHQPRTELSKHAPRITTIKVKPDQIRLVIGPGGKTIKGIIDSHRRRDRRRGRRDGQHRLERPGCGEEGARHHQGAHGRARGRRPIYKGPVQRITDFGAFIELLPGTDGLLHISEMAHTRVDRVQDVMKEGDIIEVKVLSVDRDGKVRLSRREIPPPPRGRGRRARERAGCTRGA